MRISLVGGIVLLFVASLAIAFQLATGSGHREVPARTLLVTPTGGPSPQPDFNADDTGNDENAEDLDESVDVYGNEVSEAVATYKLDSTGGLYEVHSPRTELPRLGSPKS